MKGAESNMRLFPNLSEEQEWQYLLTENYIGERAIIPMIERLLNHSAISPAQKKVLEQQRDEEIKHERNYFEFAKHFDVNGTGYDVELLTAYNEIESPTLMLFAIQGALEGVAIGAFHHRIAHWRACPTKKQDLEFAEDEAKHVRMGYPFLRELKMNEGEFSPIHFANVRDKINQCFKKTFNKSFLSEHLTKRFELNAVKIDENNFKRFSSTSATILNKNANGFLNEYYTN